MGTKIVLDHGNLDRETSAVFHGNRVEKQFQVLFLALFRYQQINSVVVEPDGSNPKQNLHWKRFHSPSLLS
jgi:hypothetical protein